MTKQIYYIGKKEFKTKKACLDYTRELITSLGVGTISRYNNNFQYFNDLINNHDERDIKIGCGIEFFYIGRNKLNPKALQLNIRRIDNTWTDVSWVHCCSFRPRTPRQNLINAMRYAISNQIIDFKNKNELRCNFCNEIECEFHIDHILPFNKLSKDFINNYQANIPTTFDKCNKTQLTIFKSDDKQFCIEWQKYHQDMATLQVLCALCNLKKPKFIVEDAT